MTRLTGLLILVLLAAFPMAGSAHELRPAYLDLREVEPDRFDAMWKVPARGDMRLALYVALPGNCTPVSDPTRQIAGNAYIERWSVLCPGGLEGGFLSINGLKGTFTDALVRIAYVNGTTEVARLTPDAPGFRVAGAQTALQIARTYFVLGVEHILAGMDHLLFVLALMLLIRDGRMLVKTITAFTIAHSLTLAGSALGWVSLPQAPVEAVIALSIAFVASELLKAKPGERRLSEAYPWLIAFAFGLLHGFGFAGALKEIGLPQTDVPLALLTFNLGVEAGQLLFVGVVFAACGIGATVVRPVTAPLRTVAAYGIGTLATVWFIERLGAFTLS
jgi:hydrogenase/urease accessory protein HupE